MMPDSTAIAVAAVFALAAVLPLSGRGMVRATFWICVLLGAGTWFIASEAPKIIWDEWLGPFSVQFSGMPALIIRTLVAAAVAEVVKATVPLIAVSAVPADAVAGMAFGAAAGAGFGVMGVLPSIARTLELVGSPIVTPLSTGIALGGWFFVLLAHTATTALVGRAGVRGGLGGALFLAILLHVILGLSVATPLPMLGGVPARNLITAVIAFWLAVYLWIVRTRAPSAPEGAA